MKINLYYGGRGVLDDPTLYVINKMEDVLHELKVTTVRYNLYELKNSITTLPQTLKEADGIILATTVEWIGIGGWMQQFLDACWLYGDKEKISRLYMQPVVMSTTYGEKEGLLTLRNAWDMLGGLPCEGLSGYVEDLAAFQADEAYTRLIEKKAENVYRTISQKIVDLPSSSQAVKRSITRTHQNDLTPQENEQLSKYISDDDYVRRQKSDLEELAGIFSEKLGEELKDGPFLKQLKESFLPELGFSASYQILIDGMKEPLYIVVDGDKLDVGYKEILEPDVLARMSEKTLAAVLDGDATFQKVFMTGDMTAKGNFKTLQMLDKVFPF
ncbi:MAG: SCP2 sterol-binding domain-containing protein [Eubacterium sp.]|nr:SCP2 sterol-binding domain-containing protein [Eubacterium sp.]